MGTITASVLENFTYFSSFIRKSKWASIMIKILHIFQIWNLCSLRARNRIYGRSCWKVSFHFLWWVCLQWFWGLQPSYHGNSVTIVTRLRAWRLGFDSLHGLGFFLLATASRQSLGPTKPLAQPIPGILSPEVKRPGLEGVAGPPSRAEFKNARRYIPPPPPLRLHTVVLN
jgi:hypothetical protein